MAQPELVFDWVKSGDVDAAYQLEIDGFPAEEAATLDKLRSRQSNASNLFLGTYLGTSPPTLIGFICATSTTSPSITSSSMSTHDPLGSTVCIHSVLVARSYQRQGIALRLLREYITRLEDPARRPKVQRLALITHEALRGLYEKAGFQWKGKSEIVHGPEQWFEMVLELQSGDGQVEETRDAVGKGSSKRASERETKRKSPGEAYDSFLSPETDLIDPETGKNKFAIYCPLAECRCLLLRKGEGKLVVRSRAELDHPSAKPTVRPPDFPLPTTSSSTSAQAYWAVPSPLTFENIGFSKNLGTLKYMICADCDCGPLGWHDTQGADLGTEVDEEVNRAGRQVVGGHEEEKEAYRGEKEVTMRRTKEFLVAVDRVRYKLA